LFKIIKKNKYFKISNISSKYPSFLVFQNCGKHCNKITKNDFDIFVCHCCSLFL